MLQAPERRLRTSTPASTVMPRFMGESPTVPTLSGSAVNSGGANNTKGNWTSLGEPANDIYGFWFFWNPASANRDHLVDIGVGPTGGGSEVVVVANALFSTIPIGTNLTALWFPLFIKGGQRISFRHQCSAATISITCYVIPNYVPILPVQNLSCTTFGADTSDSGGTQVDPGGSANTEGAWSTLGTTTNRITQLNVILGNKLNSARSTYQWLIDIGIGATPDQILTDLITVNNASNDIFLPATFGPFPVDIPPGTDVKARAQCTGTDATDRLVDVVAYGFSRST